MPNIRRRHAVIKKLFEPSINVSMNWPAFIGIVVSSIYGSYCIAVETYKEIQEIITMLM